MIARVGREKRTQLSIWVTAVEQQNSLQTKLFATTLTNCVRIDIQLLDSNDNSPVFQPKGFYMFNISETIESGTIIGQVCEPIFYSINGLFFL